MSITIAVNHQRSAKQLHFRHSRTSDGCIPTATSEAAAAMTPVSEIAEYQQRPATVNSHQCSNSNHDTAVSAIAVSTATSRTAAANLTSFSSINNNCISPAISEANECMAQPCQGWLYTNRNQRSSSTYDTPVSAIAEYQQQLAGQQPQF